MEQTKGPTDGSSNYLNTQQLYDLTRSDIDFDLNFSLDLNIGPWMLNVLNYHLVGGIFKTAITQPIFEQGT